MIKQRHNAIVINSKDNVAVAIVNLKSGEKAQIKGLGETISLNNNISFGHKFAICEIDKGNCVIKYGKVIGIAVNNITKGEHVHVHNLEGLRGRGDKKLDEDV